MNTVLSLRRMHVERRIQGTLQYNLTHTTIVRLSRLSTEISHVCIGHRGWNIWKYEIYVSYHLRNYSSFKFWEKNLRLNHIEEMFIKVFDQDSGKNTRNIEYLISVYLKNSKEIWWLNIGVVGVRESTWELGICHTLVEDWSFHYPCWTAFNFSLKEPNPLLNSMSTQS